MSQAKVDRYKEEKRNRAKIMAKEKRDRMISRVCGSILALALVCWMGVSVYQTATGSGSSASDTATETESFTINTSALSDYIDGLEED